MDQSDCIKDPNFVVIYSFIQKFSNFLSIPKYTLKQLEDNIVNSSEEICQLQQFLLKKIYKSMRTELWQRNLAKFTDNLTDDEISYLYQKEYYKLSIASKLNILKNLLESQFDDNNDLKNDLLNSKGDSLRELPIGHDNLGCFYWFQQDIDGNVYLYKENNQNQFWELICYEREGLVLTIESLKSVYDNLIGKLHTESLVNESINKNIDGEPIGNNIKYSNDTNNLPVYCNGDSTSLDNVPHLNEPKSNSEKTQSRCSTQTQELSDNDTKEPLEDGRRVLRQSIRRAGNKIQNLVSQTPQPIESPKTKKPKTYNRCTQCGKTKPSAVLTCLDCEAFYHPTCIPQTYLIVDEETPWYCPICQHKRLIAALEAKLAWFESFTETQRQLVRKKERLAIAGINIANILDYSKETLGVKFGAAPQPSDLSKMSALTCIRSCRIKKHISYQFDEYEKLMDKAIREQNNADPKSSIKDKAAPDSLGQQENRDSDSSYASTKQETSSPRLFEPTLPKSQTQSRQHEPLATTIEPKKFESYFALSSQTAQRPAARPVIPALPPDIRPRRNKRRPDRFDEQMGEEERRYGVSSSSDSSEFEYGYKPRKTTRSRRLKFDRDTNAQPDAFDDGYFMTKRQQAIRSKGAADKKKDYGTVAAPTLPNEPLDQLASLEPRPEAPNPLLMTRLVSDDAGQALTTAPVSYYKPPPTPKTCPQADSHPLLNLCHMTSLYPGPTRAPTLTPTPSPLPKTLVVRPRARPPSNCIILPVLNSGNGLLVRPPSSPRVLTSPPHPAHRQTVLVPEPSITVIEVNTLLNNVIPKTSIW